MDISSARLRSRFDIAADASLFVGSLDALAAALLLLLALWYERVALPLAVKREAPQRGETEAFSRPFSLGFPLFSEVFRRCSLVFS